MRAKSSRAAAGLSRHWSRTFSVIMTLSLWLHASTHPPKPSDFTVARSPARRSHAMLSDQDDDVPIADAQDEGSDARTSTGVHKVGQSRVWHTGSRVSARIARARERAIRCSTPPPRQKGSTPNASRSGFFWRNQFSYTSLSRTPVMPPARQRHPHQKGTLPEPPNRTHSLTTHILRDVGTRVRVQHGLDVSAGYVQSSRSQARPMHSFTQVPRQHIPSQAAERTLIRCRSRHTHTGSA
jgi:hypothetical protein